MSYLFSVASNYTLISVEGFRCLMAFMPHQLDEKHIMTVIKQLGNCARLSNLANITELINGGTWLCTQGIQTQNAQS